MEDYDLEYDSPQDTTQRQSLAMLFLLVYVLPIIAVLLAILIASSVQGAERFDVQVAEPVKPAPKPAAKAPVRAVIYFGAPWCVPCRANKPTLAALKNGGLSVVPYRETATGHVFVVDGDTAAMERFKVNLIPMWVAYENGKEVSRQQGVMSPADVRAMLQSPARFRAPHGSDGASMIEQVHRYAGSSGTFVFTPDQPIKATTDNGVTLTYSVIKGKYSTDGKTATITLDQPYPHADGRIWGLFHYGASVLGVEAKPPIATIRTSAGKYKISLEPVE